MLSVKFGVSLSLRSDVGMNIPRLLENKLVY
jgi:hypothetical protein